MCGGEKVFHGAFEERKKPGFRCGLGGGVGVECPFHISVVNIEGVIRFVNGLQLRLIFLSDSIVDAFGLIWRWDGELVRRFSGTEDSG